MATASEAREHSTLIEFGEFGFEILELIGIDARVRGSTQHLFHLILGQSDNHVQSNQRYNAPEDNSEHNPNRECFTITVWCDLWSVIAR